MVRVFLALALAWCGSSVCAWGAATPVADGDASGLRELESVVRTSPPLRLESSLRELERRFPDSSPGALARLLRGHQKLQSQDYAAAVSLLSDPSIALRTRLEDYALYFLGQAQYSLQSYDSSQKSLRRLLDKFSASLLRRAAMLLLAQSELREGKVREAVQALEGLANQYPEPAALFLLGESYLQRGEGKKAAEAFARVYYEFPADENALPARRQLDLLSGRGAWPKSDPLLLLQKRADLLYETQQWALAIPEYRRLLVRDPKQADLYRLRAALCYFHQRKNYPALEQLRHVSSRVPDWHAQSLYTQALIRRRLDQEAAFLEWAQRLLREVPGSPFAEEMHLQLASFYDQQGEREKAQAQLERMLGEFPQGANAAEGLWRLAWNHYLAGRYSEFLALAAKHLESYPASSYTDALQYWMGRSYEHTGMYSEAGRVYRHLLAHCRNDYYGQRAARQLEGVLEKLKPEQPGADLDALPPTHARPPASAAGDQLPGPVVRALERARELALIRLDAPALAELEQAWKEFPDQGALAFEMARIYGGSGQYLEAIRTLRKAFPRYPAYDLSHLPKEVWRILFPLDYWDRIQQESNKYGLDPWLVSALIRQESTFNARARSRSNAIGLMQILPSTGRTIARQLRLRYRPSKLYDPQFNIALGTYYLQTLLAEFQGKIELALAAYNGGPHRVSRWLEHYGAPETDVFVECIPLTETREYVKRILEHYSLYQAIYAAGSAAPLTTGG